MSGENDPTDDGSDVATVRLSDEGRRFAQRCAVLTGFDLYDLLATGMADLYLATARDQVGATVVDQVLSAVDRDPGGLSGIELEVARALTYLWYTGAWPRWPPRRTGCCAARPPTSSSSSRPTPTPRDWSGGPSTATRPAPRHPASPPGR
ncbi:MAG: hypothetical protein ACRDTH_11305 [Pseudonocardiaceae bacterium]